MALPPSVTAHSITARTDRSISNLRVDLTFSSNRDENSYILAAEEGSKGRSPVLPFLQIH